MAKQWLVVGDEEEKEGGQFGNSILCTLENSTIANRFTLRHGLEILKQDHQASSSELLSSAKLMAEAAKSSFNHESDKVDKGRVAGAAANLLDAASHYGKLEEKSFGKYVEKAEKYLHQYGSSHSTTTTTTANAAPNSAHHASPATAHSSFASSDDDGKSGSGYGDYFKMAEGFLKKH
ncbi:nodulin-related protein 1-like [Pistacia vera]|uniref:nodulin-related protein 1-like n=1 Tax=Pistacia vera TaxID=55513 RepID=UPI001262EAD8|nr:nodulin-related protein 1-like [Pistacia vera]